MTTEEKETRRRGYN